MIHKHLERQLKQLALEPDTPPDLESWRNLLAKIDKVYADNDQDRYLLERSLEMSSKEMQKRWQTMKLLEEQWRSLGECTPDLIVMTDVEGKITFANRSKNSTPKESLIGQELKFLYVPEQQDQVSQLIAVTLDTRSPTFAEFLDQSGKQETWFSLRIRPVVKSEKLVGLVIVETDITEVRRVAREVAARIKAEESVETKARFLANMSHEIRTPMNGIIGMTNLLLGTVTDPLSVDRLKIVQNCGNSLLNLINDLLDFSKLEVDKVELEAESFSLPATIHEVVELLSTRASEKRIGLIYQNEPAGVEWVIGDITRFRQILMNLVSNALKFTEVGSVQISTRFTQVDRKKWKVQVSVKDTGIGIPESVQNKLFLSFSQVDASTTRRFGGSGLGLAISKGLCEKMGGNIWVESEVGKGSIFSFTFLADEGEPREDSAGGNPFLNVDAYMGKKHPLRILIADDNRTNQLVVTGLLDRIGYGADVAGNGQEALNFLDRAPYDLILMDCHMPEIDGFEATRRIHEKFQPPHRPRIIALTASTMRSDIEQCFESGMDGFIGKPVAIAALAKAVQECRPLGDRKGVQGTVTALNPEVAPFDQATFLRVFEGVEDVAQNAVKSFVEALPVMLAAVEKALSVKDAAQLELAAHTLKGTVSNFYAEPSRVLTLRLELAGHDANFAGTTDTLAELKLELKRLESALLELEWSQAKAT